MNNRDHSLIDAQDILAALGLLTRLPIPVQADRAMARGSAASWAYPVAGMVVGMIAAAAIALMLWAGLPQGIVAALALALTVIITGAMHEDGLADSADGLWGGWDKARRLAIMKDSHIGAYGVIALALTLLLRWLALVALVATDSYWASLIGIGAVSRGGMLVLMGVMLPARSDGLSRSVGRPAPNTVWLGLGVAVFVGLICLGIGPLFWVALATLLCGLIARVKIDGQTGDILGATQQITEVTALLAVATALT